MNAIGAYGIVRAGEAGRKRRDAYPADEPRVEGRRAKGPGLRERIRKLFGANGAEREPGFAASSRSWLDEFVPSLSSYPSASTYR